MAKLLDIEGIGPVYRDKLAKMGLETTDALLEVAGSAKGRDDLAEKIGISGKLILEWVNRADLMRVKGIGEEFSDLLELAGVDSVPELARRNAANLHTALVEANEKRQAVRRVPSEAEVAGWIDAAKSLSPAVSH
jgi:predicted flap endonuclease-1-like 5' DNA nuclease